MKIKEDTCKSFSQLLVMIIPFEIRVNVIDSQHQVHTGTTCYWMNSTMVVSISKPGFGLSHQSAEE